MQIERLSKIVFQKYVFSFRVLQKLEKDEKKRLIFAAAEKSVSEFDRRIFYVRRLKLSQILL